MQTSFGTMRFCLSFCVAFLFLAPQFMEAGDVDYLIDDAVNAVNQEESWPDDQLVQQLVQTPKVHKAGTKKTSVKSAHHQKKAPKKTTKKATLLKTATKNHARKKATKKKASKKKAKKVHKAAKPKKTKKSQKKKKKAPKKTTKKHAQKK